MGVGVLDFRYYVITKTLVYVISYFNKKKNLSANKSLICRRVFKNIYANINLIQYY